MKHSSFRLPPPSHDGSEARALIRLWVPSRAGGGSPGEPEALDCLQITTVTHYFTSKASAAQM